MSLWSKGLRTVAVLVGVKGVLGIVGGFFALSMGHHDVNALMDQLFEIIHLGPDGPVAHWLIGAADKVNNHRAEVAFVGFGYGGFKLVESVGLWFEQRWAEWLVVISTIIVFMPVEIYELWIKITWLKIGAVILNIGVVAFMGAILKHTKHVPA